MGDVSVMFAGAGSDAGGGGTIPEAVQQLIGLLGTYREQPADSGAINLYRG